MKKKHYIIVIVLIALAALRCDEGGSPIEIDEPVGESPEEMVVQENCYILQAAVEEFSRYNLGEYPRDVDSDHNKYYDTVKDLLPGGHFLENPYTYERLEPRADTASAPGELGYHPLQQDDFCIGYYITGFGQDSIITEITNVATPEKVQVMVNCMILREAAMQYASQSYAVYAYSVNWPANEAGNTLLDLLPGGVLLENPYTGQHAEPSGMAANAPGEIGYIPIVQSGFCIGCIITGFGEDSLLCEVTNIFSQEDANVMTNCHMVRWAAELFASENGGVYPSDVDIDSTPFGNTLIDFLPGGYRLQNPYTMSLTEPFNATAANPGETGYIPCIYGGINRGYTITGVGRHGGVVIITIWKDPQ